MNSNGRENLESYKRRKGMEVVCFSHVSEREREDCFIDVLW